MPLLRFQVAAYMDSNEPRNAIVNTLYFNDQLGSTDTDQLCEDLGDIFSTGWYANPVRMTVTAYEVGSPPNYPVGRHERNLLTPPPASSCPREVAICLSYYATRNLPRQRGRMYLALCGTSYAAEQPRVPPARRTQALALAQRFSDLGGLDVDWQVYSKSDGVGRNVTAAWVDDEWDTQRSRGFKSGARDFASISEG